MRCGVDIIEISRIEEAIQKRPDFVKRVFSSAEIEYYNKKANGVESLAGFFAAKEAFFKYMGTGLSGFNFRDVSVEHDDKGMPFILFKEVKQKVSLSISHNNTTAVAVVCGPASIIELPLKKDMKGLLPKRIKNSHKGTFGRVLVVAGSKGMSGAAALSSYSALRAGAGLVTLATAESERAIAAGFYPEIMTAGLMEKDGCICTLATNEILRLSEGSDVIVFGPGLGQNNEVPIILEKLLKTYRGFLLIDADGLNALSSNIDMLKEKNCEVILTPHPGEMSRLLKKPIEEVQKNRANLANELANNFNVVVALKGSGTVVTQNEKLFINPTGNSGMATAGTGDVLAGVIAAFAAQGLNAFDATKLGVYIHGPGWSCK